MGILEFLTELVVGLAYSALGFVAGMLYMRDNYLKIIQYLEIENQQLKDGLIK